MQQFKAVLPSVSDSAKQLHRWKKQVVNYLEHSPSLNSHEISVVSNCGYLHSLHSPDYQTEEKQDSNWESQRKCICPLSSQA